MRDHRNLRAFVLADELVQMMYKTTLSFPKEEMYGLSSQMRRAAVSVVSNIVEGSARESQAEYCRFLEMAYGSLKELQYQFDLSVRLTYAKGNDTTKIIEKLIETEKTLSALFRRMRHPSVSRIITK
jgi:four helix bundle protein